jgi:nucleotide-binding universal stress UspA family protein
MVTRKFLVIADDSPEFGAALHYACRRAKTTGGKVALLRVMEPAEFEHWSGVRDEMERQLRQEAEAVLQRAADLVMQDHGQSPEFIIMQHGDTRSAIRAAVAEDPDIKILVLAAAAGGRDPGPLVSSMAREGVSWGTRKIAVTVVPGDLTSAEIDDLA